MGRFKMVDHHYDENTKRTKIVLQEGWWIFAKETIYIDTGYVYKTSKKQVFCTYPEMKEIDHGEETNFLNDCLRRIKFEKTGEIKL